MSTTNGSITLHLEPEAARRVRYAHAAPEGEGVLTVYAARLGDCWACWASTPEAEGVEPQDVKLYPLRTFSRADLATRAHAHAVTPEHGLPV